MKGHSLAMPQRKKKTYVSSSHIGRDNKKKGFVSLCVTSRGKGGKKKGERRNIAPAIEARYKLGGFPCHAMHEEKKGDLALAKLARHRREVKRGRFV